MLVRLSINNFAIINQLEIELKNGFTVITGETGSGKSILFNALNLLQGQKADFSLIGSNSSKAIVEGEFLINEKAKSFFIKNDLDYIKNTIIRREITNKSRSRIFINDTPVSLSLLKEFSSSLIQIHSQWNTLQLKDKKYQLDIFDILCGTILEKEAYSKIYNEYKLLENEIKVQNKSIENNIKDLDYNSFLWNEIKLLNLDEIDYHQLEEMLKKRENMDEIKKTYTSIFSNLSQENGVIEVLENLNSTILKNINIDPDLIEINNQLNSVIIDLKELNQKSMDCFDVLNENPSLETNDLIQQIDAFNHLLNKHRLTHQDQLFKLQNDLKLKINSIQNFSKDLDDLLLLYNKKKNTLLGLANKLHEKRFSRAKNISSKIEDILKNLKLPHTKLVFEINKTEELGPDGNTDLNLLFSANSSILPIAIYQAASGGELSRLMLALQKVISEKKKLPTILFDEIDTGVSGDVAYKLGKLLESMSKNVQLIAITHLPQVAAKANYHFKVTKQNSSNRVNTKVTCLSSEERVEEVARLMSGEKISDSAIETAKDLIFSTL